MTDDDPRYWRLNERANHAVPVWALSESCRCGEPASHKIGEEYYGSFHNMTAYICCKDFKAVIGNCDSYPYPQIKENV